MLLSGKAMLITLMDADPADEQDFNRWYDKEHIIERVSILGFLEARRYVAVAAEPKYLNTYTAANVDVLRSPDYLQALQNPTDWTRRTMAKFRNFARAVAHVRASQGQGRGGAIAFSRIRPLSGRERELGDAPLRDIDAVVEPVISAHLLQSDPELSKSPDAPGDHPGLNDWYVIVEATDEQTVRHVAEGKFGRGAKLVGGEVISFGTYRLLWDLAKAEL